MTPRRCTRIIARADLNAAEAADTVLIDHDRRYRRRILLHSRSGIEILLDFSRAIRLHDGDGLELEDGAIISVQAQPEPLLEIHAHHPADLVRIAWHLGNRHLPVQLLGNRIRIRADHVIADMVTHLGGYAEPLEAPFDPEAGAYAGGPHHHHDDDDHDH